MGLIFHKRYGFRSPDNKRYSGYLYLDINTGRKFSAAHRLDDRIFFVNEIDETLGEDENYYSTITGKNIIEVREKIKGLLNNTKTLI